VSPDPDSTQTSAGQPGADGAGAVPHESGAAGSATLQERAVALANERPEAAAGAAFAGGLLLALILKRLAR
jgi:hypothetical protein